jgi:hypothetical protein
MAEATIWPLWNSIKYGALSAPISWVAINWKVLGDIQCA